MNANDCITDEAGESTDNGRYFTFTNHCSYDVMFAKRIFSSENTDDVFSSRVIRAGGSTYTHLRTKEAVSDSKGDNWSYIACRTKPTPYGIKKKLQLYDGDHNDNIEYWMDRLEFPPDFPDSYGIHVMYDDPPLTSEERKLSTIDGNLTTFKGVVCWGEGDGRVPATCTKTFAKCLDRLGIPYDK